MKKEMKKVFLAVMMVCFFAFPAVADDTALYNLVNGKSFTLTNSEIVFTFSFIGTDAEKMEGVAQLTWPDTVAVDGYRYSIERKLVMVFFVWNDTIGIDIANADGSVATVDFAVDYNMGLIQVCPQLHFFPVN